MNDAQVGDVAMLWRQWARHPSSRDAVIRLENKLRQVADNGDTSTLRRGITECLRHGVLLEEAIEAS